MKTIPAITVKESLTGAFVILAEAGRNATQIAVLVEGAKPNHKYKVIKDPGPDSENRNLKLRCGLPIFGQTVLAPVESCEYILES